MPLLTNYLRPQTLNTSGIVVFSLLPTSSFKMSVKLSGVATSEYDELLLLLTEGTKKDIRNLWYSTKDLEDILVEGGFSKSKLPICHPDEIGRASG